MNSSRADTAYCTVAAANYLPQVVALHTSLRRVYGEAQELHVLIVDADTESRYMDRIPAGVVVHLAYGIGFQSGVFEEMSAIYDVVELATAVKPRFFQHLLESHERVVFLDPDMWLVAPMDEVDEALGRVGTVLTPHFLNPIPPGRDNYISENHCLSVGIYNLGFAAFSRSGSDLLAWWESHLRYECVKYPLLGLFVDQKWIDVGANLFGAEALQHHGYNVGPWNLFERPVSEHAGRSIISTTGEPLRLLHFSGFDPDHPSAISERLNIDLNGVVGPNPSYEAHAREYAAELLRTRAQLGSLPDYGFAYDTSGRRISRRLRQRIRAELLDLESGTAPPSPFNPAEAQDFRRWRRRTLRRSVEISATDCALAAKYAFPDLYDRLRRSNPARFRRIRASLLGRSHSRL